MVELTQKTKGINDLLKAVFGKDREETIRGGLCMTCEAKADAFRDDLSRREYTISGMCQACQDGVFG